MFRNVKQHIGLFIVAFMVIVNFGSAPLARAETSTPVQIAVITDTEAFGGVPVRVSSRQSGEVTLFVKVTTTDGSVKVYSWSAQANTNTTLPARDGVYEVYTATFNGEMLENSSGFTVTATCDAYKGIMCKLSNVKTL